MIVYRVENSDGIGPWKYNLMEVVSTWDISNNPPPYCDDGINKFTWELERKFKDEMICGAQTIELIFNWFYESAHILVENNFDISIYEIPDEYVIVGKKQVVFAKSRATKIK